MSYSVISQALEQARQLSRDITFVLLHPACRMCHCQITYALLQNTNGLYINVSSGITTWEDFLNVLSTNFQEQANLSLNLQDTHPDHVAAQIQTVIQTQGPDFTLLLDAYDHLSAPEFGPFIVQLTKGLHAGQRLILSGRRLPLEVLQRVELDSSRLIPHLPEHLIIDYLHTDTQNPILEVRAFGPGSAIINGRVLSQWDGALPKSLFYFLIDQAMTTRTKIFETFWPTLEKREATNVFHVTKRKISEILGQDLTTYGGSYYRISDHIHLYYDVVFFQEAVLNAEIEEDPEIAIPLYKHAIALYRGPFLSTLEQGWGVRRREELQHIYVEALYNLAKLYKERGAEEAAIGLMHRAIALLPQREDMTRLLMTLYDNLAQPHEAIHVYQRLTKELQAELKMAPSPETIRLAEQIKKSL